MLTITDHGPKLLCRRRDFLRIGGGLAAAGLVLPEMVRGERASVGAKSCILVYLLGGPPHLDTFDLKPRAPAEIRGPLAPISTNLAGLQICEHLPRLARLADRYALVRSVTQRNSNHTPMIYYTLTGKHTAMPNRDNDIRPPQRDDFPHMGAVLARLKSTGGALPDYIAMPQLAIRSSTRGQYKRVRSPLRGGGAGFLGPRYEALNLNGEPGAGDAATAFALSKDVSLERYEQRAALLAALDRRGGRTVGDDEAAQIRRRAVALTGAANRAGSRVFSLDDEPAKVRDRYGRHRFGQAMLMARRFAEAGVPMTAIHFNEMTVCDGWDTHSKNFEALETELLPMLDQSLSALLEDLQQRGMLDETLVVCMGEFGRTPKINKNAGRDHWGECSTTLLAGGGIRGGQVFGSSDSRGAYPTADPVEPADIQATLYHCMGLRPEQTIVDYTGRPLAIGAGKIINRLI